MTTATKTHRASARRRAWFEPSPIPGFGLSLGVTLFWLCLIVLVPIIALAVRPFELGLSGFFDAVSSPRVFAALELSFLTALVAAMINAVIGLVIAWVLVRYRFPERGLLDAAIDLPFALPTAVAGIAFTALYAPTGLFGGWLAELGIKAAYTPTGIVIALVFIGIPFVVRTVQPVLIDLERELEEAAATLGASRLQTLRRVIFPALMPALLTGFSLALARGVGEYGSVIFIAGNIPLVSEIAPLVIIIKLEQFDYAGAASVGLAMLMISFAILLAINLVQRWLDKRERSA